jgi:hypothetical protein
MLYTLAGKYKPNSSEAINIVTFNKPESIMAFLYSFYLFEFLNIVLTYWILKSPEFSYIASTAELWTNSLAT